MYQRTLAGDAEELLAFVERLAGQLDRGRSLTSWAALAAWARELRVVLGPERARTQWPAAEQAAADRVDEILERLGQVDARRPVQRPPTLQHAALDNELDDDLGRVGRFGEGVLVLLHLHRATGLELELVVVVGVSEEDVARTGA